MDQATVQPVALLSAPIKQDAVQDNVQVVPEEREIAYTINDKYFKGFEVYKPKKGGTENTVNGWWADRQKIEGLILCFKQGYNVFQACGYMGITRGEWEYFNKLHPAFSGVKSICEEVGKMMVETNIHSFLVDKDKETTRWYAERRIPEKYGRNLAMGEGGMSPVINNFGTIINTPAVKVPASVAERIKESE